MAGKAPSQLPRRHPAREISVLIGVTVAGIAAAAPLLPRLAKG